MKTFKQFLDRPVPSVSDLSHKYKMSKKQGDRELDKGEKVEGEHTSKKAVARHIAKAHVEELPDYYERLEKMEDKK